MDEFMKISVVIPVYNERETILQVVAAVRGADSVKEIVVVDDGSTDGTSELLAAIHDPSIKVLRHDGNRGKGAALRTGFAAVGGM